MPDQPWYREWRHKEREQERRLVADPAYARRQKAKRIIGDLMLVGAIVAFAWSMVPG